MAVKDQIAARLTAAGVPFENLRVEEAPTSCGFAIDTPIGPHAIRSTGSVDDLVNDVPVMVEWYCEGAR